MKISSRSSKRKSKRSQKHSKKKTRSSSEKTKKLKQRDHLESITDEDSVSPSSVSCSSPLDETRSKKRSRSRDRKRRKDKKKRKKSRLVSESSEDDSPHVKKRKRSKKKGGSDSRKKVSLKRRKRGQSISSSSRSRSPCERSDDIVREYEGKEEKVEKEQKGRGKGKEKSKRSRDRLKSFHSMCEPNDDWEPDYDRKEEKVESKERKGREKGKERGASKRSRDRSRSCSPGKLLSESSYDYSEERELQNYNPKRLKSVIVVIKDYETHDEHALNRDDGHKDEIVCDFDDYPSKSNDSNDGVNGREVVSYSHEISSVKRSLGDPNRVAVASDVRSSEVPGIQSQVAEGSGGMTLSHARSEVDDPLMGIRSNVCLDNASSMGDDLETILRQKALENLLKRQSNLSTKISEDKKTNHDIEVKRPSVVKAQPLKHHKPHDEENIKSVQKLGPTDSSGPSEDNTGNLSSVRKESAQSEEKGKAPGDFINNRPNFGLFTRTSTRKELLGAKNTWKRQLNPQEPFQKNLPSPRDMIVNKSKQQIISRKYSQPNLTAPQDSISEDSTKVSASSVTDTIGISDTVDAVAPSAPSASGEGEQSTNERANETDEEAQFQQKTMSVMRGGEMVQVSYKVYIPKKIPALARRQLKR